MKLCLGTVQFGMDYGIVGQKKPDLNYAVRCLDFATQNGIDAIDTAKAYGTAEEVVGEFLKRHTVPREKLFISTKFRPNLLDGLEEGKYRDVVRSELVEQLCTMRLDYVDAYMFHSAKYAFQEAALEAIASVQKEGLARKVGVSVYEPKEAKWCLDSRYVTFMQMPYSIFDHRMKEAGIFDKAASGTCEIHTRSAFIQGLVTLRPEQIPPFLKKAGPIIRKMDQICSDAGISRVQLAMAYVKREPAISHLVFGVDSLEQLEEDIRLFQKEAPAGLLGQIDSEFSGIEADIVMPSLWKR